MRGISIRVIGLVLGGVLAGLGGTMSVYAATSADLVIGTVQGLAGGQVTVPVALFGHGTKPGAVTFKLSYNATYLTYVAPVAVGASARAAGKDVVADLVSDGELSLAVYGLTTDKLEDGILLSITFTVAQSLSTTSPIAGSDASIASVEGDSIAVNIANGGVELICESIGVPESVVASQDRMDSVLIQWSSVPTATAYRVYRSTLSNPATAVLVCDWTSSLQYLDDMAVTEVSNIGCNATSSETIYYYWVQPCKNTSCLGELTGPASGSTGTSKTVAAMPGDFLVLLLAAGWLLLQKRRPVRS